MRRLLIFMFFSFSFLPTVHSQDNFSESFLYSLKNIQVTAPAFVGPENKVQSNLIYKTYVGKLSIIRTQYADLNYNLKKEKENTQHVIGAGFYSDREGDFFNRTRFLSRYAVHIPLNETTFLSAGLSVHVVNYSFHASGAGTSGSAYTWSGNIGFALSSTTYRLGVSFNDFNSPHIKPINYTYTLNRFSTVYAEKSLLVGANTFLTGGLRYNQIWGHSSTVLAQFGLLFSRAIGITSFYYFDKGWGLTIEVNRIKLNKANQIDIAFTYQIPSPNHNPPVSQYEINLQYYLKRNKGE